MITGLIVGTQLSCSALAALTSRFPGLYSQNIKEFLEKNDLPLGILEGVDHRADKIRVYHAHNPLVGLSQTFEGAARQIENEPSRLQKAFATYGRVFFSPLDALSKTMMNLRDGGTSYAMPPASDESNGWLRIHPDHLNPDVDKSPEYKKALTVYMISHELKHMDDGVTTRKGRFRLNDEDLAGTIESEARADLYAFEMVKKYAPCDEFLDERRKTLALTVHKFGYIPPTAEFIGPSDFTHCTALAVDAWERGETIPTGMETLDANREMVKELKQAFKKFRSEDEPIIEAIKYLSEKGLQSENELAQRAFELYAESYIAFHPDHFPKQENGGVTLGASTAKTGLAEAAPV